jgi:hypothetical protein
METKSNKFMALYIIPPSVMENWVKTDANTRKAAEDKMKAEWQKWMTDHAKMIKTTEACGKTKQIAANGVSDTKNGICLYAIVEAESHEAAVKAFEKHPHLQIPEASIEVMPVRAM